MTLQDLIDFHTTGAAACEAFAVTPAAGDAKYKDITKHYTKRAKWHRDAVALLSAPVALAIPDECPHMIVFDDADREPFMFAGAGARESAIKAFEQVSTSWNAHLFVRVERNSRDDRYPSALSTPVAGACTFCDGSGEYIDAIGDWRGYCTCPAGVEAKELKGDKP
ncbi:hypothetical protein UFOVP555_29 [uncultured Caudovirales phage]|uniref:Uncharacterized protein n=1 Tax=uncultured Caudovirales phage TaxID=2100421 RepID=A0A6J5N1E2_9CAUD|nr:hypothetical protein UFOVP555_29 [uncultured Caudovirales phage]